MRLLLVIALVAVMGMATTVVVAAEPTAFVVPLSATEEVPPCEPAGPDARGVAIFHVVDEDAGTVEYTIVANNLPGTVTAAHIHRAPAGSPGPVVEPLPLTPGAENGVIGEGTFTNPTLLAAIRAHPPGVLRQCA
jgi:hypothetical protein